MTNQKKKTATVVAVTPAVTPANVESKEHLDHLTIEQVKNHLLEVDGVSFKEARSNGNICGKIKGKTFYLDNKDKKSAPEQGITVRFGFVPNGVELQPYRTFTISGVWPACKGELPARNTSEIEIVKAALRSI